MANFFPLKRIPDPCGPFFSVYASPCSWGFNCHSGPFMMLLLLDSSCFFTCGGETFFVAEVRRAKIPTGLSCSLGWTVESIPRCWKVTNTGFTSGWQPTKARTSKMIGLELPLWNEWGWGWGSQKVATSHTRMLQDCHFAEDFQGGQQVKF